MKITKKLLIDKLREKGVSLSRQERADMSALLNLCKVHSINIEQAPTPENIEPSDLDTDQSTPKGDENTAIEPNEWPEDDTEPIADDKDHTEAMFERLKNSRVDVPRGTISEAFDVEVNNDPQPKERKKRKTKNTNEGFNVDGYILLMMLDMVLPTGLTYLFNMFEKDKMKKISASEIMLTPEQHEKMQPLADRAAEALTFKMNPLTSFAVMGSLMYANNIFMLKAVKR